LFVNGSATALAGGASDIDGLTDGYNVGNSVGLGAGALGADDGTTNNNTAVGTNALLVGTTANNNTSIGMDSLKANISAADNVAIGYKALVTNISGVRNTAVGTQAAYYARGEYNVAIGYEAGVFLGASANNNTIIGSLNASSSLQDTVLIGAGTTERLKVDSTGLYVNGVAVGGGGGAWEIISSQTVTTAVASLDFTGLSGYSSYRLIMTDLKALSHGAYLRVNLRQGGAAQTGAWDAGREYLSDTGTARLFSGSTQMRTSQLSYSGDAHPSSAMFSIDQADKVCLKVARIESMTAFGNLAQHESTIGRFNDGSLANYHRVVDGFNISSDWSGNQIIQGTFTLYGIKTS
jgi:hypothetical protein